MNVRDIAAKAPTKHDIYNVLAVEMEAYIPEENKVTGFFLRDLMNKTRTVSDKSIITF